MDEGKDRLRTSFNALLRAEFKVILRVTGLLLCCAALFLSGFYLGIYQGELTLAPETGIITGTYTPGSALTTTSPTSSGAGLEVTAQKAAPDTISGNPTEQGSTSASTQTVSSTPIAASTPTSTPASTPTSTPTAPSTSSASSTSTPAAAPVPTAEEILTHLKWPVAGKISGEPGWVEQKDLRQWVYYSGVEISCEAGAPVVAALAGSVTKVEDDPVLGAVVTIEHQAGLETTYGRVQGVFKGPGDVVSQGDQIGSAGYDGVYFSIVSQGEPLSARQCLATAK